MPASEARLSIKGELKMADKVDEGLAWQIGVWDRMSIIYEQEIDTRFGPVTEHLLRRANLEPAETVLDLGTGTGSVAIAAATKLGPDGRIIAVDLSPEMLDKARARIQAIPLPQVEFAEGRAEAIPAEDNSLDAVLASLSLMYVIDRASAAREISRVLKPGGRLVASVWAGAEETDIVKFQQTAGSFAPTPPVKGVGPGALADPAPFLMQLEAAGLKARCERETTTFQFANFQDAWDALAGVTTAALDSDVQQRAKVAVRELMWSHEGSSREFRNVTNYIAAEKPA
jgi:SAM-dependent methyltransferase